MTLFAILTLFPEAVEAYARESILGSARDRGLCEVLAVDFRDFARSRHRTVDDRPFGGGPGMVLKPDPICACIEWLEARHGSFRKIALCPTGKTFHQTHAEEYSKDERILLLCGRYEGFDARIFEELELETLSVGDYVLCGGELPALTVIEATCRLMPGVLGDERSAVEDSFQGDGGLDHPQYTRPREFRGHSVPEVLLSGDHQAIERWRVDQARKRTRERRPDLET